MELKNCHDCNAKPGEPHKDGCDTEVCSVCGGQRIQCEPWECVDHDKVFARWSGIWPGKAEAEYMGLTLNDMHKYRKEFFIKPKLVNCKDETIVGIQVADKAIQWAKQHPKETEEIFLAIIKKHSHK